MASRYTPGLFCRDIGKRSSQSRETGSTTIEMNAKSLFRQPFSASHRIDVEAKL